MNKNSIKEIIYIIIAITIGIFAVKFIIWLLPIILIGICSYYIYKKIKQTTNKPNKSKTKNKKKTIKIIDMVEDE